LSSQSHHSALPRTSQLRFSTVILTLYTPHVHTHTTPGKAGWNTVMVHFVAQTSVYWIDGPLALWLDVIVPDTTDRQARRGKDGREKTAFLQVSWQGLDTRANLRPGDMLPPAFDPVVRHLQATPQQITLQPADLRAALDSDTESRWRLILVQAVGSAGQVLAEDWLQGMYPFALSSGISAINNQPFTRERENK